MGNFTIYKQGKDGFFYPEINALRPESESITSIASRFKPIYPGEKPHNHEEPNDVKRILSERAVSKVEQESKDTEKCDSDWAEQITQLVIAQRAYELEVAHLKAAERAHEEKLEILKKYC
jgi:hypothetical protein